MAIFGSIMSATACLVLAVTAYAMLRNFLVFRFRIGLLRSNMAAYDRLPSYDTMVLKFWVWPLSRFNR